MVTYHDHPYCTYDDEFPVCICDRLEQVRADERERIAQELWPHVEPLATWVAGVNTARIARGGGDE